MSILGWLQSMLPGAMARRRAPSTGAPVLPDAASDDTAQNSARAAFDAGLAAYSNNDFAAAITCFNRVLDSRHDDADAHNNLGMCYLKAGRHEDAQDAFVLAVHFRPQFAQAHYNMALAALEGRDYAHAVACLERALELQPEFAAAHNTLGYVLTHQTGDFARGAAHIRAALKSSPADPDVLCNYSAVLAQEGSAEAALALCEQLLAAHPEMHEARLNRALAQLKRGRFAQAWPDYEARKLARGNYVPRNLPFAEWQGQPLAGRKLLIYAEQGLGDQIMFASCVPDAVAQASACMIECAPALAPIFGRSFPTAVIVAQEPADAGLARTAQAAGIDYQVAIGSLPAQFRQRESDFPRRAAYLRADPARVDDWNMRLAALGPGLKIGISWAGGTPSTRGAGRSVPLAEWLPVLRQPACHFVNLQYGMARDEWAAFARAHSLACHDWRAAVENYDETAALVSALDLVITVQTALAHLAGALGKPVWVMVPAACEWRYGERGETMPWYSAARLLRQPDCGEWRLVIRRAAEDVARLAGG